MSEIHSQSQSSRRTLVAFPHRESVEILVSFRTLRLGENEAVSEVVEEALDLDRVSLAAAQRVLMKHEQSGRR